MDWRPLLRTVAPTLTAALGTPLAGVAEQLIADAVLGQPGASQTEVDSALSRATPETLAALRRADQEFAEKMAALDLDAEKLAAADRADARTRQVAVRDRTPAILAGIYTAGYFATLGGLLVGWLTVPAGLVETVSILFGILSGAELAIIQYYFGSSAGSRAKDMTINTLSGRR